MRPMRPMRPAPPRQRPTARLLGGRPMPPPPPPPPRARGERPRRVEALRGGCSGAPAPAQSRHSRRLCPTVGQEDEICTMVIECCAQERTYLRFYGSLGERFCMIKNEYQVCSLRHVPTPHTRCTRAHRTHTHGMHAPPLAARTRSASTSASPSSTR